MATTFNHTATHPTTGETFTRSSVSRVYSHAVIITRAAFSEGGRDYPAVAWAEWSGTPANAERNAATHRRNRNTAIVVPATMTEHTTKPKASNEQATLTRRLNRMAEGFPTRLEAIARADRYAAEVLSGAMPVPSGYGDRMTTADYAAMWADNAARAVEDAVAHGRELWHLAIQRRRLVGELAE